VEEIVASAPGQVLVRLTGGEGDSTQLLARITAKSADNLQLVTGTQVYARIKSVALLD
jgi:molybdopterin-binding protein